MSFATRDRWSEGYARPAGRERNEPECLGVCARWTRRMVSLVWGVMVKVGGGKVDHGGC
jgi:hypothetical protein